MYIVSFVIGIALFILMLIMNSSSESDAISVALLAPLAIIVFPIEVCGMILNWKKVLKGFIAPIPILSSIIQSFVGMWYAIKALIAIVKNQDLVLGEPDNGDNQ